MELKSSFRWTHVIITAIFCIIAAFGGGIAIKNILAGHGGWIVASYGISAGIFIAIAAVILMYVIPFLTEKTS